MRDFSKLKIERELSNVNKVIIISLFITIFALIATILVPVSGMAVPFWNKLPFWGQCVILFASLIIYLAALTAGYDLKAKIRGNEK